MLGLAMDADLIAARAVIAASLPDACEHLEQYIELDRFEVGRGAKRKAARPRSQSVQGRNAC